ncbi:hypothetical protein V8D89_004114 [Ganoderma adspersum]
MGRSATSTQESAQTFLERLQHEIESINNALAKATVVLREAHNERCPLLNLPIEILHKILELVPDSCTRRWKGYHPFWRNTLDDSSILVPVTHTCRRLREVALAHPIIWTTFQLSLKKLALARQMATWSSHLPLNAVGSDVGVLEALPPNTCFQSIHLYGIGKDDRNLRALADRVSSTALSSLSLFCNEKYDWDANEGGLPLSLARATNLRDLALDEVRALPNKGFPRLTRLALLGWSTPIFHERVVNFIRECPQLENIALHEFTLTFANGDVPHDPAPIALDHLRHVTLVDFSPDALTHYLALLQPRVHGSSVQIMGYHGKDRAFPTHFLLPPPSSSSSQDRHIKVCIGVHPTGLGDYSVSLTTVFAHTTRRIASWVLQLGINGIAALQWPSLVFADASPLWVVDEVWLYGLGASSSLWKRDRSPLTLFPIARTAVLVAEGGTHHDDPPILRLLPFVHPVAAGSDLDPNPESEAGVGEPYPMGITTLRIVHGFSEYDVFCEFAASHGTAGHTCRGEAHRDGLSLSRLIQDLRSGGYGYLKHFVLQATPHIDVDERELDVLKNLGQFETFRFERIEEFPEMPGHSDPAQRGGERYPGALW